MLQQAVAACCALNASVDGKMGALGPRHAADGRAIDIEALAIRVASLRHSIHRRPPDLEPLRDLRSAEPFLPQPGHLVRIDARLAALPSKAPSLSAALPASGNFPEAFCDGSRGINGLDLAGLGWPSQVQREDD